MLAPTGKRGEREREKQPPIHTLLPLLLFSGSSPADQVPPPLQHLLPLLSNGSSSPAAPPLPPVQQLLLILLSSSSSSAVQQQQARATVRYTSLSLLPHPPLLSFFFAGLFCASWLVVAHLSLIVVSALVARHMLVISLMIVGLVP